MLLGGKTAVVTGGAGTIGEAVVRRFLAAGARVALVDRDAKAVAATVERLDTPNAYGIAADVADEADTVRFVAECVERFGQVNVFFANAGIEGPVGPLEETAADEFDRVMAVNVRGVFLGLKHIAPALSDGGSVVVTSSVAGLRGATGLAAYSASKHAVMGLVRTAATEWAPRGIRVNAINPGPVEGRMMRAIEKGRAPADAERSRAAILRQMRLGRYVSPKEVAGLVLFLASDESRMITGRAHTIDAGLTLG